MLSFFFPTSTLPAGTATNPPPQPPNKKIDINISLWVQDLPIQVFKVINMSQYQIFRIGVLVLYLYYIFEALRAGDLFADYRYVT